MYNPKKNPKYWEPIHLGYLKDFMLDKIKEEEYIQKHQEDHQKFWYELMELKRNKEQFAQLLKKVSLPLRRRLLLNIAATNISWRSINEIFDVTNPKISRFINRGKIRGEYDLTFVSSIAVLCRVPIAWLLNEVIEDRWDYNYFDYLNESPYTCSQLIELIHSRAKLIVKGIVLVEEGKRIYLRLEKRNEGFIIEVFNREITGSELQFLSKALHPFECKIGYVATVIKEQVNYVFIGGTFDTQDEFIKY